MAFSQIIKPAIPPATTLDQLRLIVANGLTQVVDQVNTSTNTSNLNINNYRVTNVQNPSSPLDAVNLITLQSAVDNITNELHAGQVIQGTTAVTTLGIQVSRNASTYPSSIIRNLNDKMGEAPSVLDFNAKANGIADDSGAIQNALNAVSSKGGGILAIPRGTYLMGNPVDVPSGVWVVGAGADTLFQFNGTSISTGSGLFNFSGTDAGMENVSFDGGVVTPSGVLYSAFAGDPMSPLLTSNSTIWVHPGAVNIRFRKLQIQHTGGYAILVDSETASIDNITIDDCDFINNRPHLFGTDTASLVYGAWTGGVFIRGNCQGTSTFAVNNITVTNNRWRRCDGNCLWMHAEGFDTHHTNIKFSDNSFEDIGLDGIQPGNIQGGVVSGNSLHRVGYVCMSDSDVPTPAYLPGAEAVGIDCTGYADGVTYSDNHLYSVNGEFIDLDGFRSGGVKGNVCIIPDVGTPQYTEDQIGLYGVSNVNITAGINLGDTSQNGGATDILITDNTLRNCGVGAIRMSYAKRCIAKDNHIDHPTLAFENPIILYCPDTATNHACFDNRIEGNHINYSGANLAIAEVGTGWSASMTNTIFNNHLSGTSLGEFLKNSASASLVGAYFSSNDPTLGTHGCSVNLLARIGAGSSAALRFLSSDGQHVGGTYNYLAQLTDIGPILNLGTITGTGTSAALAGGLFTTANRSGAGTMTDLLFTGKVIGDGFYMLGHNTYNDADANEFDATYGMFRYVPGTGTGTNTGTFQLSTSTLSSTRQWQSLTFGSATAGGSDQQIQFNDGGSLNGSPNLLYDKINDVVKVTALASQTGNLFEFHNPLGGVGLHVFANANIILPQQETVGLTDELLGLSSNSTIWWTDSANWFTTVDLQLSRASSSLLAITNGSASYADVILRNLNAQGTAFNSISAVMGGMQAVSFASIRNDGGVGALFSQGTNGTASGQAYSIGVTTSSLFYIANFTTTNTYLTMNPTGTVTIGNLFQVDQAGNAVANGVFTFNGTGGGINISADHAYNSIQNSANGGILARNFTAISYINTGISAGVPVIDATHSTGDTLNNGAMYYDSTLNAERVKINGTFVSIVTGTSSANVPGGTNGNIQYYGVGGTFAGTSALSWNGSDLLVTGAGTATPAIFVTSGYVQSDGGFLTTNTAAAAIQAPSGGMTALQFLTTNNYSLQEVSSFSVAASATGFAKIYADNSSHTLKVSQNGGSFVNIVTGAVVNSLFAGSGISVSANTGSVTVSNSGVLSLGGSTGSLNLSAGTGVSVSGLTISIGQSVSTSAAVTFGSVTSSGAIQSTISSGSIAFQSGFGNWQVDGLGNSSGGGSSNYNGGYKVGGNVVINSSGAFVGTAGIAVQAGGIGGGAYGVWTGGGYQFGVSHTLSGSFTTLIFNNGICVFAS